MVVYTISDVEKLTGIRAPTLRAWEQRYELVAPHRDENNARVYGEEDLRELSTVALLHRHGYRISRIAAMSPGERVREVAAVTALNISPETRLDALTLSVLELDPCRFSMLVDAHTEQRGFEETMMKVIFPLLDKLGLLYFTGSITAAQESFTGGLIRQKVLAATDRLPAAGRPGRPVFTLFLPEGERQELSMLFIQYLLRKRGFPVVYVGTDVSCTDLGDLYRVRPVDYLFTILSSNYVARPVEDLVQDILDHCPDCRLLLSGYQAGLHDLTGFRRVERKAGLREMIEWMDSFSTPAGPRIAVAR
ncbi:DNA-binding transcriptional MerR regulator [Lewinella marina]|uniref:Helix-turn-helix-type transcriptional regulator n=1 Tax=Neolewinella marina TaxID=438751 RepID=A0A2G0CCA2_9BACT|nr:MerR family transcriptional regulator [Neolewinella marina]NJB86767.1 DNA-binding transcriptional MerR regulator [Neolewinella marina]PHK97572.1 helix-turn-helix-type transcriptional regulator [Neolewinella marina]